MPQDLGCQAMECAPSPVAAGAIKASGYSPGRVASGIWESGRNREARGPGSRFLCPLNKQALTHTPPHTTAAVGLPVNLDFALLMFVSSISSL